MRTALDTLGTRTNPTLAITSACSKPRSGWRIRLTIQSAMRAGDSEHASDDNGVVRGVPDAVDESLGLVHGVSFDGLLCFPFKGIRQIGAILHAKRSVSDER